MAQDISLLNAVYPAVPAILLPKQGGGTARYDDASVTTAVASDVASGKVFLASDGTITTGTASGGGGASNFVQGTFKGTTSGSLEVSLNYSGNGYPVAIMIWPTEGGYNSDGEFYKKLQRYAICTYCAVKNYPGTPSTYPASGGDADSANVRLSYKNSTSTSYSLSTTGSVPYVIYTTANPSNGGNGANSVHFISNKKMKVYISGSSYGYSTNIEYTYIIYYSS